MDSKWTDLERKYNNTFERDNSNYYLFSDASFLKKVEDFKPERQWEVACGKLFKEDNLRRYFCNVETKKDFLMNIIIPTNTCYDQFYIYDHNYIENELIEIYWRDMLYSFDFKGLENEDFEKKYMATRGKIIKQSDTHILFEIDKYIISSISHREYKNDYKYLSIPKSYIHNLKKVGGDWQVAPLKRVIPKLDPIITESKIKVERIRKDCDEFSRKHNGKKSFLPFRNSENNNLEYGIYFSYAYLDFGMKYIGKIGGIFNRIKEKFFKKRISKDVYK